jgi:hypothetical protein
MGKRGTAFKPSKCWTCSRAYALPDPYGCAWHRQEHVRVWDEAAERSYEPSNQGRAYTLYSVTSCRDYTPDGERITLEDLEKFMNKEGDSLFSVQTLLDDHHKKGVGAGVSR